MIYKPITEALALTLVAAITLGLVLTCLCAGNGCTGGLGLTGMSLNGGQDHLK